MSHATETLPACAGAKPRTSCLTCALRDACRRFWIAQRTRAELSALTDIELKDIGLHRSHIPAVASGAHRR